MKPKYTIPVGLIKGEKTEMEISEKIDLVVANVNFGKPSAAKRGRREQWPYVPVIDHGKQSVGVYRTRTEQIKGKAFDSRQNAIDFASSVIDARKKELRRKLNDPRYCALRASYGLPFDI